MKVKKSLVGQHILDGLGDTESALEYIEDLIPWIGEIVVAFNGLEATLDSVLCEMFSDRSDQMGLLVLHSMMYSTKVELYKKFCDDFIRAFEWSIPSYRELISDLKECGVLRNKVVHANWEHTNDEGYTQVKYKVGKEGLEHEMCQFTPEYLERIFTKIYETRSALGEFDEERGYKLSEGSNRGAAEDRVSGEST